MPAAHALPVALLFGATVLDRDRSQQVTTPPRERPLDSDIDPPTEATAVAAG